MNFLHILGVIKSRKWMIIGIVAVTLIVVALAAPDQKTVYVAKAYLTPSDTLLTGTTRIAKDGTTTTQGRTDGAKLTGDLITIAQGASVYQKAIDFLALPVAKQQKTYPGETSDFYKQIVRPLQNPNSPINLQNWHSVLTVLPVRNVASAQDQNTNIICIQITVADENTATHLANAVGYGLIQAYKEKSQEDSKNYESFLVSDMEKAKKDLDDIQNKITQFKQAHNIVTGDEDTQKAFTLLASLQSAKMNCESDISEIKAAIDDLDKQLAVNPKFSQYEKPDSLNGEYKSLKDELVKAQLQLEMLAQQYTPEHPKYKAQQAIIDAIQAKIDEVKSDNIQDESNPIHQTLLASKSNQINRLAATEAKLKEINGSLTQAQAKVDNLTKTHPGLVALMREYAKAEGIYNTLSDNLTATRIARNETTRTGSIIPVDWARAALPRTDGPSRQSLMIYGFVISLVLGIILAVWLDSIDKRVRNATDVEKMLELPVIGLTPQLRGRGRQLPKLTHLYPLSAIAESYKILRTNILFELRDSPFKTLMISTGRPGQGGTTTICNIAISLAQIGKKIILIDADMRRPSLHKFFSISNDVGLSSLLQGKAVLTDALQSTDVDNLVILPAGPQPLNPSELLGSDAMRNLVSNLEDHCDLVLFDSPSTVVFSDGPMLASWVDAVIMVVSANLVPRGTETQTRDLLRKAKANIIGVVVNRLAPDNIDSCYFYSHYYSDTVPGGGSVETMELAEEGDDFDDPTAIGPGEVRPELDENATEEGSSLGRRIRDKRAKKSDKDNNENKNDDNDTISPSDAKDALGGNDENKPEEKPEPAPGNEPKSDGDYDGDIFNLEE